MGDHAARLDCEQRTAAGLFDPATWRKSLASEPNGGNCVEVNFGTPGVGVRDSKLADSPVFVFGTAGWNAFLDAIRTGR